MTAQKNGETLSEHCESVLFRGKIVFKVTDFGLGYHAQPIRLGYARLGHGGCGFCAVTPLVPHSNDVALVHGRNIEQDDVWWLPILLRNTRVDAKAFARAGVRQHLAGHPQSQLLILSLDRAPLFIYLL